MTVTTPSLTHIYLHNIPEKDAVVIQRVITFAASQGKPYQLTSDAQEAHIIITLDAVKNPITSSVHIAISETDSSDADIIIKRPLLVTRVMRSIDDAVLRVKHVQAHIPHEIENASAHSPSVESTSLKPSNEPQVNLTNSASHSHIQTSFSETGLTQTLNPTTVKTETTSIAQPQPTTASTSFYDNETDDSEYNHYAYTALVVDDSAAIRKQLELELRDSHIFAEFAETGEEALTKVAQKRYDLVFLDIILPEMNGYDVCKAMRKRAEMKKTPIIMLSGKTSPLDEVQGVLAGASTYLTKPVKHEQFQQTLRRVSKWLSNFASAI